MNQRFFELPQEKQKRILNSGYKVFSESCYKKAPVAEIAKEAGISKALLFHYFHNKKELYLYLWKCSVTVTREQLRQDNVLGTDNLFVMMRRSLYGKCEIMRRYPYLVAFSLKAYFEQDPEIRECIQTDFNDLNRKSEEAMLHKIRLDMFPTDINIRMVYREMIWAADGYLHMAYAAGDVNADKMEQEFEQLIQFWETVYKLPNGKMGV